MNFPIYCIGAFFIFFIAGRIAKRCWANDDWGNFFVTLVIGLSWPISIPILILMIFFVLGIRLLKFLYDMI